MTFTIPKLIDSIAGQIAALYPDADIYDSPTFDTDYPCFYVFVFNPSISDGVDGRDMRKIGIDIVYVRQRNESAQNKDLNEVSEALDEAFDTITYVDGEETATLHTHERNTTTEDQELHYKFEIRQRVSKPIEHTYMAELEDNDVEIKEQ